MTTTSDAIALVRTHGAVTPAMVRRHLGIERADVAPLMAAAVDSGEIFVRGLGTSYVSWTVTRPRRNRRP